MVFFLKFIPKNDARRRPEVCLMDKMDHNCCTNTIQTQSKPTLIELVAVDHLLRVEDLEEDMDKHNLLLVDPFTKENIPLPHKNKTENKFEMDISPEHEELIYFLHYEDFQAGGYKRLYK